MSQLVRKITHTVHLDGNLLIIVSPRFSLSTLNHYRRMSPFLKVVHVVTTDTPSSYPELHSRVECVPEDLSKVLSTLVEHYHHYTETQPLPDILRKIRKPYFPVWLSTVFELVILLAQGYLLAVLFEHHTVFAALSTALTVLLFLLPFRVYSIITRSLSVIVTAGYVITMILGFVFEFPY